MRRLLVHHLVDLPGWEGVAGRQVDLLERSGLLDALDEAHLLVHYDGRSFDALRARLASRPNVRIVFDPTAEAREAEVPSVAYLRALAAAERGDAAIAYVHLKGVTRPGDLPVEDWARYMEHVIVGRWRDCVARLEGGADTCGVNLRLRPYLMYAGNFWWTRASYARGLLELRRPGDVGWKAQVPGHDWDARFDAEAWILSGTGRHVSLDTSPVRDLPAFHYEQRWPEAAWRERRPVEFAFATRGGKITPASRLRFWAAKRLRPLRGEAEAAARLA